jgi:Sister chromatid cohesion protein Dcc1
VKPKLDLLKGNFYHPTSTAVQYLPNAELPGTCSERFGVLFAIKEKWELNEILPFLEECVESGDGWEKKAERECQRWGIIRGTTVVKR